jgi:hypothetical protein
MDVKCGVIVLFWWFMVVSQYSGGTLRPPPRARSGRRRSVNGAVSKSEWRPAFGEGRASAGA